MTQPTRFYNSKYKTPLPSAAGIISQREMVRRIEAARAADGMGSTQDGNWCTLPPLMQTTATPNVLSGRPRNERGWLLKRPACDRGHLFTPENTYYEPPRQIRRCRTCRRLRERRYRSRRAA